MSDTATATSSFSKALALGEVHEDLVFPYPEPRADEQDKIAALIKAFNAYADEKIDMYEIDQKGWIDDQVYRELGELGLLGLYVPEEYGGQGLSQTGYARVFEAIGQVDGSLTIGLGVHQSIGFKGIVDLRHRRAEGALPPRPRHRQEARRLRADRAQRRLGRLQHRVARGAAARRLVGPQRREALHRQRRVAATCSRPSRARRSTARTRTSR